MAAKESAKEFYRFLYIALASLAEVETQFNLTTRLNLKLNE